MNTFHMIVKGKRGETFALKVSPSADIHTITRALHAHTPSTVGATPLESRHLGGSPPRLKRNDRSDSSVRVTPAPSVATVIMGVNWQLCYQGGARCRHQCLGFFCPAGQWRADICSIHIYGSVSHRLGEQREEGIDGDDSCSVTGSHAVETGAGHVSTETWCLVKSSVGSSQKSLAVDVILWDGVEITQPLVPRQETTISEELFSESHDSGEVRQRNDVVLLLKRKKRGTCRLSQ